MGFRFQLGFEFQLANFSFIVAVLTPTAQKLLPTRALHPYLVAWLLKTSTNILQQPFSPNLDPILHTAFLILLLFISLIASDLLWTVVLVGYFVFVFIVLFIGILL